MLTSQKEVIDVLWKLEQEYFDKMLCAIQKDHKPLEEKYKNKCDAIARARAEIAEMR